MSARLCACGCGRTMEGRSMRAIYARHSCAQKESRRKLIVRLEEAQLPTHLNRAMLASAPDSTRDDHTDSQRRPRSRSGVRLSFAKALEAVTAAGLTPHDSLKVKVALLAALSEKQRAVWRQRLETR